MYVKDAIGTEQNVTL